MQGVRDALEQLEGAQPGQSDSEPELSAALAYLAGLVLEHDETELHGAFRRAELLLVAGGNPRRAIELSDRAVDTVTDELATPERVAQFSTRLAELEQHAQGLPATSDALRVLRADPGLAWRIYAWALLTEHVHDEGS